MDIIIKNMPGASVASVTSETDTHYKISFTIKDKKQTAEVLKTAVVAGEVEVKDPIPAIGETVFLVSRAKMSDWIRSYKKEEHKFLITQLGRWFELTGIRDEHGIRHYQILIPDSPFENKVYEVPALLIYTY
jgi:hypothetical protein